MHWPCAYCCLFFLKPKFVFTPPCPSRGSSGNPRAYWTIYFWPVKERLKEAPFIALEKQGNTREIEINDAKKLLEIVIGALENVCNDLVIVDQLCSYG